MKLPNTRPDHTLPQNWRASSNTGGSPGADDLYNYAAWSAEHPGTADPNANPDADELNNRLEYAFARDPNVSGPVPVSGSVLSGWLTITFTRRTDASDLTFTPEFSPDLTSWTPAAVLVSSTPGSGNTVTETWRAASPVSSEQRLFVRVKVN